MHPHVAYALFMGPGLILAAFNEAFLALASVPPVIGVPVSEGYTDPRFRTLQRAMRHVLSTGLPVRLWAVGGWMWLIPYEDPGGQRGVVSRYQPTPVLLAQPAPALRAGG